MRAGMADIAWNGTVKLTKRALVITVVCLLKFRNVRLQLSNLRNMRSEKTKDGIGMVTLLQKLKLLRGFLSGENAYIGPLSAVVDVTRRCNLVCVGCQFHSVHLGRPMAGDSGVQDMPYELFSDLCEELRGLGTRKLYLIGEGEPFLQAQIFDFIKRAKSSGFHLEVFTNGTTLTEEKIQTLVDLHLDQLSVSIWTAWGLCSVARQSSPEQLP
jgi:uncharacterized Fe-S radical SAM superfamily protein PflX